MNSIKEKENQKMCSTSFLSEFIRIYQENDCLWKIKSSQYQNRQLKSQAYDKLVAKMKEIDPNADRSTVAKKINTIRCCYRKELKKVRKSIADGRPTYTPRLWYYDQLDFLKDQESTKKHDIFKQEHNEVSIFPDNFNDNSMEQSILENFNQENNIHQQEKIKRKKKRKTSLSIKRSIIKAEYLLDTVSKNLCNNSTTTTTGTIVPIATISPMDIKNSPTTSTGPGDPPSTTTNTTIGGNMGVKIDEDEFSSTGSYIAMKLRRLNQTNPRLRTCVEKLIHELLLEAEIGEINKDTKICNYAICTANTVSDN